MSAVSGGGNYISDGQIMAWLATQQDRLYGELGQSMDMSNERANFTDDLNNIKADLHDANGPQKDFTKVTVEMKAFMEKYGSDPEFADLCAGLKPMFDDVCGKGEARIAYNAALEKYNTDATAFQKAKDSLKELIGSDPTLATQTAGQLSDAPTKPTDPGPQSYDADKMKEWDELIGGKIDVASRNDQLTMIHIQQIKATLDQGSQMASTFISSSDKTQNSIINNIA